jgi:hypothetical protein
MKVIIAGSRSITEYADVNRAMQACGFEPTEIVCGGQRGAPFLGQRWAYTNGIPLKFFPPDRTKWGRSADRISNLEMAKYADALVALWDGESERTIHLIAKMRERNKPVYVHHVGEAKGPEDVRSEGDSDHGIRSEVVCAGGVE